MQPNTDPVLALDWQAFARIAIEREPRPAFLVDAEGTLRAVNQSMLHLVGWSEGEVVGRRLSEVCPNDDHDDLLSLLDVGRHAGVTQGEIRCKTRRHQCLVVRAEIQPIGEGPSAAALLVVNEVQRDDNAVQPPLRGIVYDVETAPAAFGHVVRAWPAPGSAPVQIGETCYRQLYGRDSPCEGCPAARLGRAAGTTATDVVVHPGRGRLDVVHATRLERDGPVRVTTWPVDEALLARLFGARVQWLSADKGLSAREHAVLELLLMGRSAAEIAVVLDISPRTAKYHQRNVQRKLGAESRQDLLRVVL